MCLTFNTTTPTHQGTRKVWKVLQWYGGKLRSRYFREYAWKSGLNQSGRLIPKLTFEELQDGRVEEGFHVYTSRERAEESNLALITVSSRVVVEMAVDSSDFVCEMTEWNEAVYTKVTLAQEEFARVRDLFLYKRPINMSFDIYRTSK